MNISILVAGQSFLKKQIRILVRSHHSFYDMNEHLHSCTVFPDSWTRMDITIIVEEQRENKTGIQPAFSTF